MGKYKTKILNKKMTGSKCHATNQHQRICLRYLEALKEIWKPFLYRILTGTYNHIVTLSGKV